MESQTGSMGNLIRSSAKVAPVGCQPATMAFKLKLSLSQKVACAAEVVTQHGKSVHLAAGLSCPRLAGFLPPWQEIGWDAVVQPGPGVTTVIDLK